MTQPTTTAYVGHNGRLVATCECGAWYEADDERAALPQLLAHQLLAHRTSPEENT